MVDKTASMVDKTASLFDKTVTMINVLLTISVIFSPLYVELGGVDKAGT